MMGGGLMVGFVGVDGVLVVGGVCGVVGVFCVKCWKNVLLLLFVLGGGVLGFVSVDGGCICCVCVVLLSVCFLCFVCVIRLDSGLGVMVGYRLNISWYLYVLMGGSVNICGFIEFFRLNIICMMCG